MRGHERHELGIFLLHTSRECTPMHYGPVRTDLEEPKKKKKTKSNGKVTAHSQAGDDPYHAVMTFILQGAREC